MLKTIKIKRGLKKNLPVLSEGELAFTTDDKGLFIGTESGNAAIGRDRNRIIVFVKPGKLYAGEQEEEFPVPADGTMTKIEVFSSDKSLQNAEIVIQKSVDFGEWTNIEQSLVSLGTGQNVGTTENIGVAISKHTRLRVYCKTIDSGLKNVTINIHYLEA